MDSQGNAAHQAPQEGPSPPNPALTPGPAPQPDRQPVLHRLKEFLAQRLLVLKWEELARTKEPKDFWAGLQSIFVIIAIIVGGVWTGITFGALRSVNNARAELESRELEIAQNRDQRFDIELNLDMHQIKPPTSDNNHYIAVLVRVKNIGTGNIVLCLEEPNKNRATICPVKTQDRSSANASPVPPRDYVAPIAVSRVTLNADSTGIILGPPKHVDSWREDDQSQRLTGLDIRVGQTESLTALVPLKEPGLYRVAFAVREPEEKALVDPSLKSIWSISKYFALRENSELDSSRTLTYDLEPSGALPKTTSSPYLSLPASRPANNPSRSKP